MAELYLIRHGKTYGNTLGRYIGTTDEELCEEGREALKRLKAGRDFAAARPDVVYASPLKRCVQTAEICGNVISERLKIRIIKSFPEMRRIRPGLTAEGL